MNEDIIVRQGKVVCALVGKSAFEERHIDAPIIVPLNVCRNYQYSGKCLRHCRVCWRDKQGSRNDVTTARRITRRFGRFGTKPTEIK